MLVIENERERPQVRDIDRRMKTLRFLAKVRAPAFGRRRRATAWQASMSTSTSKSVTAEEMAELKGFDDLRRLRAERGDSIFTIAPHPFYKFGGSIGSRLFREIDCFDAIEFCHFHVGLFNPNRRAKRVASRFNKPLIATSDAHRLHAFGRHYTSIPLPLALTVEKIFAALRNGPSRLTSPPSSFNDLVRAIYFVFLAHPFRRHRKFASLMKGSASEEKGAGSQL